MIDNIFEKYSKGVLIDASHYMDFIHKRMNRIIEIKMYETIKLNTDFLKNTKNMQVQLI